MNPATEYVITIPGRAATKGSMKCVGRRGKRAHVLVESHETAGPWRETVAGWLTRKGPSVAPGPGQPLAVEVTFTLERPKAHRGTGRNAHRIKPRHVDAYPVGHNTGDVDKLVRLVLDAMQDAGVLPDDAQVCDLTARKRYTTTPDLPAELALLDDVLPYPGVRIRLHPLT